MPDIKDIQLRTKPSRWLLKAYIYLLIFVYGLIIMSATMLLTYFNMKQPIIPPEHQLPHGALEITILLCVITIYLLLHILNKKRWAFWGFAIVNGALFFVSLYLGSSIWNALAGMISVPILFILLYMGGKRSAWNEMN